MKSFQDDSPPLDLLERLKEGNCELWLKLSQFKQAATGLSHGRRAE
jgi:hypothetical protein